MRAGAPYWLVVVMAMALGAIVVGAGVWIAGLRNAATGANIEVRPTNEVLVAIENLSRLEVTEVKIEKVVDLKDKQDILGITTEDSMLLIASGSATIGVDFDKMEPGDASFDESTKTAKLRLPAPELLSSRLDPDNTYVYKRETGMLATRNEGLETRARKEAIAAVERAASTPEIDERARKQTERTLTLLLTQLGAKKVEITWKKAGDSKKPSRE